MPYVCVSTSQHISAEKAEKIQKEIGRIVAVIPGKNIDNCMTQIIGDCPTFMSGKASNSTFCEIRMLGKAPAEAKKEFAAGLNELLSAELEGLDKLYINFQEYTEWAVGSNYIEV